MRWWAKIWKVFAAKQAVERFLPVEDLTANVDRSTGEVRIPEEGRLVTEAPMAGEGVKLRGMAHEPGKPDQTAHKQQPDHTKQKEQVGEEVRSAAARHTGRVEEIDQLQDEQTCQTKQPEQLEKDEQTAKEEGPAQWETSVWMRSWDGTLREVGSTSGTDAETSGTVEQIDAGINSSGIEKGSKRKRYTTLTEMCAMGRREAAKLAAALNEEAPGTTTVKEVVRGFKMVVRQHPTYSPQRRRTAIRWILVKED
jgi:hypothetical protein